MRVIYAEKPDIGTKIAAALDCIHLDNGTVVSFDKLLQYENEIKRQRATDGMFRITYKGEETIVTWGYGHMVGLKQAYDYDEKYRKWSNIPLPYIPESYELKITTDNLKQFRLITDLFHKADLIICATDNDREGDLIFDYIYRYSNCKTPFMRALFNKQAQSEFQKAFDNLVSSYDRQPVIDAGRARSAGDFISGAGPTVAMTLKYDGHDVLSVGRVQTAVLNMIYEREKEILNFKPKDYWVIQAEFGQQEVYIGEHINKKFEKINEAKEILKRIKEEKTAIVTDIESKNSKKGKPNLYSLQTLQMDANKKYGFSLDYTLKITQSLYEKGYVTYPRTDSLYLPEDMKEEMDEVLRYMSNNSYFEQYFPPISKWENYHTKKYFDNNKVGSHYAIVTTKANPKNLSPQEEKIYLLIAKSVITMVYPDAVICTTTIKTTINGEDFITKGSSVKEAGYMKVTGIPKEHSLPNLAKEEIVSVNKVSLVAKKTEPPKRYTGASLLVAMINCGKMIDDEELRAVMTREVDGKPRGLGRPSTQASIVKTLETRGYIEIKNKTIYPTSKGMKLIEVCPVNELKSAVMTAEWEKRLDDIEAGKDTYEDFMHDLENTVRKWTEEIMSQENKEFNENKEKYYCPICRKVMKKVFWGYTCSQNEGENPICDFHIGDTIAKKKIPEKEFKNLFTKGSTGLIKGFTSKNNKKFDAYIVVDKQNKGIAFKFEDKAPKETELQCPICNKALNKMEWGYGCSGYKEGCTFSLGKISGHMLTEDEARKLIKGKKISLKGLKSKTGRKYDADISLCLQEDDEQYGKYVFSFPE